MARPTKGYYTQDGTRVPSVTTITGRFKPSQALMHWAFEQGRAGTESLHSESKVAASIGSLAHKMVELDIDGFDPEDALNQADPGLIEKARNAFAQYEEWKNQTRVRFLSGYGETPMVSETHRFGGTPDAIGYLGDSNRPTLIDLKTSNSLYPDYLIQVEAYRHLWNENHPEEPLDDTTYLLRISRDWPDFEVRRFGPAPEAWQQFLLHRKSYELDKQLQKRVR